LRRQNHTKYGETNDLADIAVRKMLKVKDLVTKNGETKDLAGIGYGKWQEIDRSSLQNRSEEGLSWTVPKTRSL
jgi:hypothetical protein